MSAKTVRMLQTVEDSEVITDPEQMAVSPIRGHVVKNHEGKGGRVLKQTRVGVLKEGQTYTLPTVQADEQVRLGYAQEVKS